MKLHLPKMLRKAVMACMAAIVSVGTTVGTGVVGAGAITFVLAGTSASAAEYTNPDNLTTITFANGDVLNLGAGAKVEQSLTMDAAESSITLNVTDGTVEWAAAQAENYGVSQLNIATGATLNVTSTEGQFCVFSSKAGGMVVINMEAGAKMVSNNLFGWENQARGDSERVVNMGAGAKWTINAGTNFYLNRTTLNLSGGEIVLNGENTFMWFERRQNGINTTEDATQMSIISGAGAIKAGNNGTETEGYTFNVVRGAFDIDSTNTADLLLSARLINADAAHGVQKMGDGVMQVTSDSSGFTHSFFVRAGEVKFTGNGNIGSGSLQVLSGATLTLNTKAEFAGGIKLQDGGTLNLAAGQKLTGSNSLLGTVSVAGTVTLTGGSVSIGDSTVFDLSDWTGGSSYQLFTLDGGTVSAGKVQVQGVTGEGTWMLDATGLLALKNSVVWSSGTAFTWQEGTVFDEDMAFANGMLVEIGGGLGNVTATLAGDLTVPELTVKEGTNFIISGENSISLGNVVLEGMAGLTFDIASDTEIVTGAVAATNDAVIAVGPNGDILWEKTTFNGGSPSLLVEGKMTLKNSNAFNNAAQITVDGGELVIDYAGFDSIWNGDLLIDNGGKVSVITNGSDLFNWGDANKIEVLNGSTLDVGTSRASVQNADQIILKDGSIIGTGDQHGALDFFDDGAVVSSSGTSSILAPIRLRANGNTTEFKVTDGTLTLNETCDKGGGSLGNMEKTGEGTLVVTGALAHRGSTTISAGTLQFEGSTLAGKVVLNGGALNVASATDVSIAGISGTGNVSVAPAVQVGAITDMAGTITVAEGGNLILNAVDLAAGMDVTVTGVATAGSGFAKTGEGQLTLDVLNVGGDFVMNGVQGLSINALNLQEGSQLVYSEGDVLSIGSVTSAVSLNVYGVAGSLAEGINTGITLGADQSLDDLKSLLVVDAVDSFTLIEKDGMVWLSSTATVQSDWDINWGATLASAPASLTELGQSVVVTKHVEGRLAYDCIDGYTYVQDGVVAISVNATQDANDLYVAGGEVGNIGGTLQPISVDAAWIEVTGGMYKAIVGGSVGNSWGGSGYADFTGDTHVLMRAGTTEYLVGGNLNDGNTSAVFNGDSYVSVYEGATVTVAVIGGSTTAHGKGTTFNGNTHVFVYTCLPDGSYVIGGNMQDAGSISTNTVNGTTNVTVDLSSYAGESTQFMAAVAGGGLTFRNGSQAWSGASMMNINGDTNVTVIGKEGITFTRRIVGGTYARYYGDYGTRTPGGIITGTTNVNISGGSTYNATIIGGSYLNLNEAHTTTSSIGGTNLSIDGGTFAAEVLGGSWHGHEKCNSTVGDVTVTVSGGAALGSKVLGGSYVVTGSNTITAGNVTMDLQDSSITGYVIGAHNVEGTGSAALTATVGDISITLNGATTAADIYGGSIIRRNSSDTVTHGDIAIELNSGTIGGSVYAGGYQAGSTLLTVESTTVTLSKDVALTAGKTISGGFRHADGKTGATVTGAAKLIFADAVTYSNVAGVNFADFNAVEVVEGGSVSMAQFSAMGATLTKDGAGAFSVTDHAVALDSLTMNGGSLSVQYGVTSTDGLSAKITAPSKVTLGKDLTLAALDIDLTGATAGVSIIDVAGELSSNGLVNVNLTGIASLEVGGEYVLISAGETSLTTDALNTTLDATAPEGVKYVVEVVDNKLVFRSSYLSAWVWEGDTDGEGSVWSDNAEGWQAEAGSPAGQDVYFTSTGAGEVTISGTVTPANINVSGGEYIFVGEDEDASIQLREGGVMSVTTDATLVLALDNENLGGTTDLAGTLKLQSENAIGDSALQFNGGTLVYDTLTDDEGNKTHIRTDLSQQSSLAADYNGPVKIEVTDAENTVTWLKESKDVANSGVDTILASGIEKTGDGEMTVQWQYGTSTNNGAIDVKEGSLNYIAKVTQGAKLTMAGGINVAGGADFHIESDAFATGGNASTIWVTISGNITGAGNVSIGSSAVKNGRYFLSGDNSSFAGTLTLHGNGVTDGFNRVGFEDAAAFGGAASTVQINGRGFYFNPKEITAASAVTVIGDSAGNVLDGSTDQKITFTGAWTVAEDAAFGSTAAGPNISYTVTLAGDLSAFAGTLRTRSNNTWVLGGDGVDGSGSVDMAAVTGDGKLKVQYGADTVLNTVVADSVALQQSGAGKLIIASENTTTGKLTVDADAEVQLGAADVAGSWAGSTLEGAGKMTLVNGALTGLTTKADTATLAVETTEATVTTFAGGSSTGTVVDLTGSDASLLDSIKLAEGSTLIVDDALTVGGEGNTTLDMSFTADNIGASAEGLTSMIQGGDLTIAGTEGVNLNMNNADVLTALNNIGEGDLYLQLTDGALATAAGIDINDVIAPDLLALGVRAQLTEEGKTGGYVVINGDISGVYFTDNQEGSSADTADTVTVADSRLEVFSAVVINEGDTLEVATDTTINNLNGQEDGNLVVKGGSDVVLNNEQLASGVEGYDPMGADNALAGNLTGEEGSTITMQGEGGSLTVGGALTADTLVVESGSLVAEGDSEVADLTIAEGAAMEVGAGKSLALTDADISGELSGTASEMTIGGAVSVDGTVSGFAATLADGSSLEIGGTVDAIELRGGDATINGAGGILNVGGGSFGGTLSGAGALTNNGAFTLDNATGSEGWAVTNNGSMVIDITDSGNITLGALALGAGSDTTLLFNSDNGTDDMLTLQDLAVEDTAGITLKSIGSGQLAANEYKIGEVTDWAGGEAELAVDFSGTAFSQLDKLNSYIYVNENGEIILNAVKAAVNELANAANHPNAAAGAELLWHADAPVGGDLEDVYNTINDLIAAGAVSEANEAMAAVAGASTASLGMAFAGDVERQLRAIRNRTTTMGVNQCVVNEGMPYFNAWVNAEGNMGELDKDGLAAGYQLDSWGGTVGFDVDVNPNLTLGLAVTAMYGDFTVDGPDKLDGDLDSMYVSAFARYSKRAWTHTFVGTIGKMDSSYDRTVSYGNGDSYKTQGETDGMAFGLMYEVGRVFALAANGDACLQPVFNVAYRHTSVGGYKEEGSDAALDVDDQTLDTITLGAGARMQAVVGENLYNRTSVLELRALAKFDIGDRASESDVALVNGTGRGTVESAELGAFGVELGAGLSVPMGDEDSGTLFFDISAELRSGYSNLNGTVGYRINF